MNREPEFLKEWRIEAAVPANFNSVVWRKIEQRTQTSAAEMLRAWLIALFARRSVTASYLSLAVAAGLVAAHIQSSRILRERAAEIEGRYVQSVDPYALRALP